MHKKNRSRTRRLLFQELYALCFGKFDNEIFLKSFFDGDFSFETDEVYLNEMKKLVLEKEPYLIEILKKYSPKFEPENMSLIGVISIFIGLTEMIYLTEEIPGEVSINEAIEISKIYGEDSAKKIVNGVLSKIFDDIETVKKDIEKIEITSTFSFFKT